MEILHAVAVTMLSIWAAELLGFALLWWRWHNSTRRDR
jgi:hypothetical protein